MKMHPWFKTLLVMVAVIGPMYWLMFTIDGQRRSDTVMLAVFGAEGMELDLKRLDDVLSEDELREVYPALDWHCNGTDGEDSEYGADRRCGAAIGSWNGIPARQIMFHFAAGRLRAMQMDYRAAYQQSLLSQIREQLGPPSDGSSMGADGVLQWFDNHGVVVIKAQLRPVDQAALIWMAADQGG